MTVPAHARGYDGFSGHVGRTVDDSIPAWPQAPSAAPGSPNIVLVGGTSLHEVLGG